MTVHLRAWGSAEYDFQARITRGQLSLFISPKRRTVVTACLPKMPRCGHCLPPSARDDVGGRQAAACVPNPCSSPGRFRWCASIARRKPKVLRQMYLGSAKNAAFADVPKLSPAPGHARPRAGPPQPAAPDGRRRGEGRASRQRSPPPPRELAEEKPRSPLGPHPGTRHAPFPAPASPHLSAGGRALPSALRASGAR